MLTLCKQNSMIFGCNQKIDSKNCFKRTSNWQLSQLHQFLFNFFITLFHCTASIKKQKSIYHNSKYNKHITMLFHNICEWINSDAIMVIVYWHHNDVIVSMTAVIWAMKFTVVSSINSHNLLHYKWMVLVKCLKRTH